MTESVLIVGAGSGLSASLARLCSSKGMKVVLAARDIEKLQDLKKEIGASTIKCDATKIKSVTNLFKNCLLYTSPSPRDATLSRMPSSA